MRERARRVIPFHEAANIFPMIEGEEFQSLINDIRKNGQQEAIWTYQGKIIDGRNRYNAILRLQEQGSPIVPKFREWSGKGNLTSFVVSLNLHRRHLNESQRALIASKLAPPTKGRPKQKSANSRISQTEAAQMLNVSRRTVQEAAKVVKHGDEKLVDSVKSGEMSVAAASQTVDAAKKYPEIAATVARPKDLATISKNLDKLPEPVRKEKIKKFVKGDLPTIRELANKNPVQSEPKSKAQGWAEWVQDARIKLSKVNQESYREGVLVNWSESDRSVVLNAIDLFIDDLETFRENIVGGLADDGRPEESFEGAIN
jgi:hypothetical protein